MKLSIVIPAYNEELRIGKTIKAVKDYLFLKGINFEFIFVNDGSRDKTVDIIRKSLEGFREYKILSHEKNRGKGAAIKTGMLSASGDWILFMDSDLSTPIEELEKFIPFFSSSYTVIIGTRKAKGAMVEVRQNFFRENMGKVFTFLSNLILGTNYSDFTCGFKCFRKDASFKIFSSQKIENWSYDSEILFLAKKYGFQIIEIPVRWINDPNTKVRLIKDTIGSFMGLLRIRANNVLGRYE